MNKYNHFLTPFILLFVLFINTNSIFEVLFFSLVFGVLIDQNQRIGKYLKKPADHRRTWVEEPAGLLFIGFPLGFLLSLVEKNYLFMVIIPYATHIVQDYITLHKVSPLAPFSGRVFKTGFFRPSPPEAWNKGISENYFLLLNIILTVAVVLFYLL